MTSTIEGTQRRAHESPDSDSQSSPYHGYIDGLPYLLRWRDGLRSFSFSEPPIAGEAMLDRAKLYLRGHIRYASPDHLEDYLGEIWCRGSQSPFRIDTSPNHSNRRKITVQRGWLFSGKGLISGRCDGPDTGERRLDEILALVPVDSRRPYKMRRLLELLVDEHRILEIQPEYGASLITAIARLASAKGGS